MPEKERECVVWCAKCGVDKFEVWRVPLGSGGHAEHVTVPDNIPAEARKFCECGTMLERK
jgi:hypothetical protein